MEQAGGDAAVWCDYTSQHATAGRPHIDAFEAMLMREDRPKGSFGSFDYTQDATQEISNFSAGAVR